MFLAKSLGTTTRLGLPILVIPTIAQNFIILPTTLQLMAYKIISNNDCIFIFLPPCKYFLWCSCYFQKKKDIHSIENEAYLDSSSKND